MPPGESASLPGTSVPLANTTAISAASATRSMQCGLVVSPPGQVVCFPMALLPPPPWNTNATAIGVPHW